jgi:hypothetical protein
MEITNHGNYLAYRFLVTKLLSTASKHTGRLRLTIMKTSHFSAYFRLTKKNSPAFGGRSTKVISTKNLEQYGRRTFAHAERSEALFRIPDSFWGFRQDTTGHVRIMVASH